MSLFINYSNIFSYRMSVAILRMPHSLDYSLILSKSTGNGTGHVNNAFNGSNEVLTDDTWNATVPGKILIF